MLCWKRPILEPDDDAERVKRMSDFLREFLPQPDERSALTSQIAAFIMEHKTVMRVDEVAEHFNMHVRTLERLFKAYVGVSPSWVIRRYRLHDALERLSDNEVLNGAALAKELGYFDQAHFIRDFKAFTGQTPRQLMPVNRDNPPVASFCIHPLQLAIDSLS